MARATNAVLIHRHATEREAEEARQRAKEAWERSGRVAAWGCKWYEVWLSKVEQAIAKRQRLKAVFYEGQMGYGKLKMEDLPTANLWDNFGCGGSQKCELATADFMGWEYDQVDVGEFLAHTFPTGCTVDALDGAAWRRCQLLGQVGEHQWEVRCSDPEKTFSTHNIRHPDLEVENMLDRIGGDLSRSAVQAQV